MGFLVEKAGELVLNKALEKVESYKEKKQWEELFVNTNEFLLKQVEFGDMIIEEIADLLSGEDMKKVAMNVSEESEYLLRDKLYKELGQIMIKYEIPANEAEFYISNFINIIFYELERINPDVFQCAFLGEWKAQEEQDLNGIKKQLLELSTALSNIQENKVSVYSIDQIEIDLFRQTVNPSLNLDFFEIDDEVFKEKFEDCLEDECIYIKGQCKEETILCLLNELRRVKPEKLVFIVKSAEDWEKLIMANEENIDLGGKILIPWFYSEHIYAVPNNTNIFVFGEDEYCVGKKQLSIRKRKRNTISKKLVAAGLEYEEAYRLVNDTHGLYMPLKKKIIRGINNITPAWIEGNKNIIIPLLLCGKWTESDGDKMIIEELCGLSYAQVMDEIMPYMKGEEPLFVKFKACGNAFVHLASTENAWDYLDEFVDIESNIWSEYVEIIRTIITEENPIFNFPPEQQVYADIMPGGKKIWSSTLKEGLLRSLIMKAYYKNNPKSQSAVNQIVEEILNDISSTVQWLSIAEFFEILCEASPKAVIKRLDKEWQKETGLKEVFLKAEDTGLLARNDYTHFIWGLEQFLCQKEYSSWAVRWFLKMNSFREKYPISNSPLDTLKRVFCPWYNVTVLSQKDKIVLAKEAFEKGYDIWELLYSELPGRNTSLVGIPYKPKYRIIDDPTTVTTGDVRFAYREYLNLCLTHMDFDISKWEKIIKISNYFNETILKNVSEKLLYEIQSMDDIETIRIKEVIRKEIYRNRYFCNSEWTMSEEMIKELENLMSQIKVQNEIYEYRYLFVLDYDFPLLHPRPYSEDKKREINAKLINDEILAGLSRFKEQNLDVVSLAHICAEMKNTTLGRYLFQIYTDEAFDQELFSKLIIVENSGRIALDYVKNAYIKSSDSLKEAVDTAKGLKAPEDLIVGLLLIEVIDIGKMPLISYEDEKTKEQYWKQFERGHYVKNAETAHYIIEQLILYSDLMHIIEILDECKEFYDSEEILVSLEKVKKHESGIPTQLSSYHLKNLLSVLQTQFLNTEYCERVASIELLFRGLLEVSDMKCFLGCLKMSPKLLIAMVAIIFKDDNGNPVEGIDLNESQIGSLFSLYYNLEFCPAEYGTTIDTEKLMCWVKGLEDGLNNNNQTRLFGVLLGKVLSNSPVGMDGYYPTEAVREVIEKYGDQRLENEYAVSICNSRGVYTPTGGDEERAIAKRYKENADAIRTKSPKTAKIFDHLYEDYLHEANSERESEEYAGI